MKRIEVLFQYTAGNFVYRGVRGIDGAYRAEKRGVQSKNFRTFCWSGSIELLMKYNSKEWRHYYATGKWPQ